MKAFYIETYEGLIRDDADFMTPTDFIKANRKASLDINFFPPKCILNEFCISEIELYDIVNDENENNRLFTNRELEFRKGKRFTMDDIFYAFSIEYDQLTIDISDYISWKNRHKEWCEEKKRIEKQIKSELCGYSTLETELTTCREQLEKARVENPSPNTKTSAATKARQEKNLAEWKDAFKAMIPVILQCQEEGPKPRTTPELATMCAKNGVTLDKTKMAFLRECLLECLGTEYINTTGGPTIQG